MAIGGIWDVYPCTCRWGPHPCKVHGLYPSDVYSPPRPVLRYPWLFPDIYDGPLPADEDCVL